MDPDAWLNVEGFRGGSSRESLERRYGTLGRQPKEQPPPYHILPRSSYLLIPQDTPDLLRYRKFLPAHPSGYTRPTQVQQILPAHPSGYTRPTQVQEALTSSSLRIHQTYSGTGSFYLLIPLDTPDLLRYRDSVSFYLLIP